MSRNMASTSCECGFWSFSREPWPVDDARLKTEEAIRQTHVPDLPLLVRRVFSARSAASWPRRHELYDLSFWHAWNDEPCDADRAEHREVTREDLAAAVAAWFARKA